MTASTVVALGYALAVVGLASVAAVTDRHELSRSAAHAVLAAFGAGSVLFWAVWVLPRMGPGTVAETAGVAAVVVRALLVSLPLSALGLAALLVVGVGGSFDGALSGACLGAGAGVGVTAALADHLPASIWEAPTWPLALALAWGVLLGVAAGALRLQGRAILRIALGAGGAAGASVLASALVAGPTLPAFAVFYRGSLGRWLPLAWLLGTVFLFWVGLAYERRVIADELGEEAQHGVLPDGLVTVAASWSRRVRSGWWPRGDERREINRMLSSLAFRKHRWRQLPEETARVYGLELGRLRERIRAVLNPRPDESLLRDDG